MEGSKDLSSLNVKPSQKDVRGLIDKFEVEGDQPQRSPERDQRSVGGMQLSKSSDHEEEKQEAPGNGQVKLIRDPRYVSLVNVVEGNS